MRSWFSTLILFSVFLLSLNAQEGRSQKLQTNLLLGYKVGGQGENRNFVTKNGPDIQVSLNYRLNKKISAGVGIGYEQLEKDRFIPIFAEATALFKDGGNSPYLKVRIGGSPAYNLDIDQFELYDFDGGLYFTAGWGYHFSINEQLGLLFELNLEFQQADLEFRSFSGEVFDEDFQYYFLAFKTGVKF